jgi:Mg/Co/Ni transporter MgtE
MAQAAIVVNGQPQPTNLPRRKIITGGIAGAVTVVIVFVLNAYVLPGDKPIPADIASAITTIITFAISFLTPPGEGESVV